MDGTAAIDRLLALARVGPRDSATEAREADPYVCRGCGVTHEVQYHVCPECGGFSVEARTAGVEGEERRDGDASSSAE
jgi:rRNA maturation endonuclease Nob1